MRVMWQIISSWSLHWLPGNLKVTMHLILEQEVNSWSNFQFLCRTSV